MSREVNTIQHWKEISSHEKTWRKLECILLSEKKANLKRLCIAWLQLYEFLIRQTLETVKKINDDQGLKKKEGWIEYRRFLGQ